jgi:hypothetical protein
MLLFSYLLAPILYYPLAPILYCLTQNYSAVMIPGTTLLSVKI